MVVQNKRVRENTARGKGYGIQLLRDRLGRHFIVQ